MCYITKSLKIPKGLPEAVNRRRADNGQKKKEKSAVIYKTLLRKL